MKNLLKKYIFIIPLAIGVLIFFGPTIFGGRAFFWGLPILQFVPWWSQVKISLLEGWLPLWNPNSGMGAPLLANYQLAFFYPPNLIFLIAGLLADTKGIAWVQAITVSIHIFWSGLGMYFLLRKIGLGEFGRIIGSVSFAFSGTLIARGWFLSINAAISWLPWLLLAVMLFSEDILKYVIENLRLKNLFFGRRFWLLVLVFSLQLLSGHAQMTWYSIVFSFCWMIFWIFSKTPKNLRSSNKAVSKNQKTSSFVIFCLTTGLFGIALLIAALITSVQLIPTAEYLFYTPRASQVDYEIAMTYSFWPWRLLGLFAPNIFGNPANGDYWGYASYWEDAVYIGLIPILLAIGAVLRMRRLIQYSKLIKFLLISIIISFLLAFGKFTPIFPFLYRYIPSFDMFNGPARWSILAVASLSILAGFGSEGWTRPIKKGLYWTRLGTFSFVVIILSAGIGWLFLQSRLNILQLQTLVVAFIFLGIWGFFGGILTLNAPQNGDNPASKRRWQIIVVMLIVIDLFVANYGLNPSQDLNLYSQDLINDDQYPAGRFYMPKADEIEIKFGKYFSSRTFHAVEEWPLLRQSYLANLNILNNGRPSVNSFDPFVVEEYSRWIEKLEQIPEDANNVFLNLSWVSGVVNSSVSSESGSKISIREPGSFFRWYECVIFYQDNAELLSGMVDNYQLLEDTIFLLGNDQNQTSNCQESENTKIVTEKIDSHVKHLLVDAQKSGWLFISETWYPGWTAKVDGNIVDIDRANYNFMAIEIPSGKHDVFLYYFPSSVIIGCVITIITIVVSISLYIVGNRKICRR